MLEQNSTTKLLSSANSVSRKMAVQADVGTKEEVKTQFSTVEGVYKVLPLTDFTRPNRIAYNNTGGIGSSPQVRVSFVCIPETSGCVNSLSDERTKISFNYGREIFLYSFKGLRQASTIIMCSFYYKGNVCIVMQQLVSLWPQSTCF